MPMHDWTRVIAGTYHDFHCCWMAKLTNCLNQGGLPTEYYAQIEEVNGEPIADILTLSAESSEGGVAVAVAPPRVRFTESIEPDAYAQLAKHVAIRHSSGDRIVALIELVSPGNKRSDFAFRKFRDKALESLRQGCHLLVIDPFPPGPRDPQGMHGAIWSELGGQYTPPADKPLTLAAYRAGWQTTAYVEPIAVGDALIPMPLFLTSERYVPVPLEETYLATYKGVPRRWQRVLEGTSS